jgi:hypothetical protein
VEATKAAPPSFIALPREMALLSRPMARSSKRRTPPPPHVGSAIGLLLLSLESAGLLWGEPRRVVQQY